jgi:hypothetical protein
MEPQEYYHQGQIDHDRGMPISSNPYAWGTVEQASWARGWKAAKEAKRKKFSPQDRDDDEEVPF